MCESNILHFKTYIYIMLNVTQNLLSSSGINEALYPYKMLNLGGEQLYVMGISKILKFQTDTIVLSLKKNKVLEISGTELYIKEISKQGILICGKITSTEVK